MEDEPKKRGRKAVAPEHKKKSYTLALTGAEADALEKQAEAAGAANPSQYVVKKLKLS